MKIHSPSNSELPALLHEGDVAQDQLGRLPLPRILRPPDPNLRQGLCIFFSCKGHRNW